jgi:hypothetical protein
VIIDSVIVSPVICYISYSGTEAGKLHAANDIRQHNASELRKARQQLSSNRNPELETVSIMLFVLNFAILFVYFRRLIHVTDTLTSTVVYVMIQVQALK